MAVKGTVVTGRVWDCSPKLTSGQKLTLLAIAKFADDETSIAFPSEETIGRMINMTERGVQKTTQQLAEKGELHIVRGGFGRGNRRTYAVLSGLDDEHRDEAIEEAEYRAGMIRLGRVRSANKGELLDAEKIDANPGSHGKRTNSRASKGELSDEVRVNPGTNLGRTIGRIIEERSSNTDQVIPIKETGARKRADGLPVDEGFIVSMIAKWGAELGGDEGVREAIAEGLNHRASDKYKDMRLYLQGWLRREARLYRTAQPIGRNGNNRRPAVRDPDRYVEPPPGAPKLGGNAESIDRMMEQPGFNPDLRRAVLRMRQQEEKRP